MDIENKMDDSKSRTIDLETNLLTPEDALLCLSDEIEVILPTPNVRACNNLDEYLIKSTKKANRSATSNDLHSKSGKKSKDFLPTFSNEPFAVPLERNFNRILKKPYEGNGETSSSGLFIKPRKMKPDVFSRTEALDTTSGPLHLLKTRLHETVKILIRRRRKVPYISRVIEYKGILIMFDKHMNVYLKDVIESFKYSLEDKILKRARHRENLLLRGDNIILIR